MQRVNIKVLIPIAAILKPKRRIGIRYGPSGTRARLSTKLSRRFRNSRENVRGPRTRYIVVGSTSARRISMLRNSPGIRGLSHLPRFQPTTPPFFRYLRYRPSSSIPLCGSRINRSKRFLLSRPSLYQCWSIRFTVTRDLSEARRSRTTPCDECRVDRDSGYETDILPWRSGIQGCANNFQRAERRESIGKIEYSR